MNIPYPLHLFKINTLQIFINIHTYTYALGNNGIPYPNPKDSFVNIEQGPP